MIRHPLTQSILIIVGVYTASELIFTHWLDHPIPSSLMAMYMAFVIAGVMMVQTFTEDRAKRLFAPLRALLDDPTWRTRRNMVLIILPLLAGAWAFNAAQVTRQPPVKLRTIHPTPPATLSAYDQSFDMERLENPLRATETESPKAFAAHVAQGAEIYAAYCAMCHGAKLDGGGLYAKAMDPPPLPFNTVGTIDQLQESYVFWRIVKGGPGLPREAAPWDSAMPGWEDTLSAEQIWQVILYLYDYTDRRPMRWEDAL